jgi:hypothetical protein
MIESPSRTLSITLRIAVSMIVLAGVAIFLIGKTGLPQREVWLATALLVALVAGSTKISSP